MNVCVCVSTTSTVRRTANNERRRQNGRYCFDDHRCQRTNRKINIGEYEIRKRWAITIISIDYNIQAINNRRNTINRHCCRLEWGKVTTGRSFLWGIFFHSFFHFWIRFWEDEMKWLATPKNVFLTANVEETKGKYSTRCLIRCRDGTSGIPLRNINLSLLQFVPFGAISWQANTQVERKVFNVHVAMDGVCVCVCLCGWLCPFRGYVCRHPTATDPAVIIIIPPSWTPSSFWVSSRYNFPFRNVSFRLPVMRLGRNSFFSSFDSFVRFLFALLSHVGSAMFVLCATAAAALCTFYSTI